MSSRNSRSTGYGARSEGTRQLRKRFLILCEGSKTEPGYFRQFPASVEVQGLAFDPLTLVQEAVRQRHAAKSRRLDYDQVWCVFDRDEWPLDRFNQALALAHKKQIFVAYSNEAFELWYLLHFHYCDTACHRSEFEDRLNRELPFRYRKNDPNLYSALVSRQAAAVKHAEMLLSQYDPPDPAHDNPSTTVHLLVQALKQSSRP
jgi:hypothetical protein